jgi:hypothetical protein
VLPPGSRHDLAVLLRVATTAQCLAFVVLILPWQSPSDIDFVVHLENNAIIWPTLASIANAVVEPNNLASKLAPLASIVGMLHWLACSLRCELDRVQQDAVNKITARRADERERNPPLVGNEERRSANPPCGASCFACVFVTVAAGIETRSANEIRDMLNLQ